MATLGTTINISNVLKSATPNNMMGSNTTGFNTNELVKGFRDSLDKFMGSSSPIYRVLTNCLKELRQLKSISRSSESVQTIGNIENAVGEGALADKQKTNKDNKKNFSFLGGLFKGSISKMSLALFGISFTLKKVLDVLKSSSAALRGTFAILGVALKLFFKPFGDALSMLLRPLAIKLLKLTILWEKYFSPSSEAEASGEATGAGIGIVAGGTAGAVLGGPAGAGIGAVLGGAIGTIVGKWAADFGEIMGNLTLNIRSQLEDIDSKFNFNTTDLLDGFMEFWGGLMNLVISVLTLDWPGVKKGFNMILDSMKKLYTGIMGTLDGIITLILGDYWTDIKHATVDFLNAIIEVYNWIVDKINYLLPSDMEMNSISRLKYDKNEDATNAFLNAIKSQEKFTSNLMSQDTSLFPSILKGAATTSNPVTSLSIGEIKISTSDLNNNPQNVAKLALEITKQVVNNLNRKSNYGYYQ